MSDTPASTPPEPPKGLIGKLGAALPVALTAIATAFAGMSTTELQRAMFWRSAASQDQAKATSQWTLAGFKRDRSLIVETAAMQIRVAAGSGKTSITAPAGADATTTTAAEWLAGKGPPTKIFIQEPDDETLKALLNAIRKREPEATVLKLAGKVKEATINSAIDSAENEVAKNDADWTPIVDAARGMVGKQSEGKSDWAAGQADLYGLEQRRYRAEANLNQGVGFLYEARVKVSTAESDKHRQKSEVFFYAMLAAQVGATVASLALARREQSALWLLAGVAGLVSIAIGGYVYLGI